MPKFTVEVTCLVPEYCHLTVEAASAEEAQRIALEQSREDARWMLSYEGAAPDCVTGVWSGPKAYEGGALPILPDLQGEGRMRQ